MSSRYFCLFLMYFFGTAKARRTLKAFLGSGLEISVLVFKLTRSVPYMRPNTSSTTSICPAWKPGVSRLQKDVYGHQIPKGVKSALDSFRAIFIVMAPPLKAVEELNS